MNSFPFTPRTLSNDLVGLVVPRTQPGRQNHDAMGFAVPFRATDCDNMSRTTHSLFASHGIPQDDTMASVTDIQPRGRYSLRVRKKREGRTPNLNGRQKMQNSKSAEADMIRYREQCRVGMARYRAKKRNDQLQLEMSVEQLKKEVKHLKRRYGDVSSRKKIQHPWNIVAEVFQVLETTFQTSWHRGEITSNMETRSVLRFCERLFPSEVAMGDFRGIESLIDQLRQYAQYFGSPKLRLQRVESMAPGVLTATANLSLTVTEFAVQYVFSQGKAYTGRDDGRSNVYQRLLGQRLECCCSLTFLFDENLVSRLESSIDMIRPLLRVLGSVRDVSEVLQHSRITAKST